MGIFHCLKKRGKWCGSIVCILSVIYFNKTLIGPSGSIGREARQEVGVEQRDWEYSGKQEAPFAIPAQINQVATCELTAEKGIKPYS